MKQFIHTYDKALKIGGDYTSANELSTTLRYIFKQHYSCYMLCVKDRSYELYKLESKTGDSELNKQINKTLKRKKIKTTTKTWRVMGCIIKPFKKEPSFATEWISFLDRVKDKLSDGVYILSLSDSVLLPDSAPGEFLPVFAYSGKRGYRDIPIPTYDDIFDRDMPGMQTDWGLKKAVAVFRGSSTGCGSTAETNQRLKLATLRSDTLDVGITKYTSNLKYTSPTEIGKPTKVAPVVPSLSWAEQSKYKYIVHVDGNVVAYRLLKSMLTNSVILRVKSDFIHWCDSQLKPGVHYLEIRSDLSDLQEIVEWCKAHDVECKKIAAAGYTFARELLTDERIESEFVSRL